MISIASATRRNAPASAVDARFLSMLPQIEAVAALAFRAAEPELRSELVAEVVANCFCAFCRLVARGREEFAYATPLAWYAVRQIRAGRRVGSSINGRDISSPVVQRAHGIKVERLDYFDNQAEGWRQALVEDRHAGPDLIAAARIDVGDWLRMLPRTKRRVARMLASGESTGDVARKCKLSAGRISQLRKELEHSWKVFQGEQAQ